MDGLLRVEECAVHDIARLLSMPLNERDQELTALETRGLIPSERAW